MITRKVWIHRIGAVAFVGAALYHLTAVLIPPFGAVAYPSTYPLWRHVLFILVDSLVGWWLFKHVRWAVWLMGAMTLQIYNGHGRSAWAAWTDESRMAWIDVLTVAGASALLALLAARRGDTA